MKFRKVMAVVLAAALTFSMAACGDKSGSDNPTPTTGAQEGTDKPSVPSTPAGKNEEITIGTWWYQYYDSLNVADGDMTVSSDWVTAQEEPDDTEDEKVSKALNRQIAQHKWDNVKRIEEKHGVTFYWENLTYEGVKDSINTSILAGAPDCDVYLTDAGMAIPAQANGLAIDLKTILPADHDIFTTQKIATYFDLGDGKACIFTPVKAENVVAATYPLAFNKQLLEDNNLEDPRALWERGEWTWDKFIEYCQVLTQDTDGDGQMDQFGYCGYVNETFEQLMMSNGTSVANTKTENLSSPEIAEVLQMIYDMYNTYNVCYPYDLAEGGAPWDTMRVAYREGTIGFWPTAVWIQNGQGDYSVTTPEKNLTWDTVFVRWPVGPSGNKDTNAGKNYIPTGDFIIPAGVQEPEKVFNVMYDFWNFAGDIETTIALRDDRAALNWWYNENAFEPELQDANFAVMYDCGSHTTVDLWGSLEIPYDFNSLINGTVTPAQFQETHKQQVQDALDSVFGN
ncbi:MAG: extracellular solute-binding protein [Lachnospiraceae bacterium]|nr:extracellular solute-binding protein [Lachnospiraceae bacterium]